ncbi:hypothetical protein [Kribbella speibonae]|uniref:Uncharacterized protein n=1 Tax=Kribbella speibonae TaxID=1572660 RepID=A0A4R0J686_9ACTN|nr:hypothetical protein [Kribbella speibonae]TCC42011.1 hypothetical protein E0H92_10375 [Kribbella speibonae]
MSEPSQEGTGVRARYSRWRATSRGRKTLKAAYAQAARDVKRMDPAVRERIGRANMTQSDLQQLANLHVDSTMRPDRSAGLSERLGQAANARLQQAGNAPRQPRISRTRNPLRRIARRYSRWGRNERRGTKALKAALTQAAKDVKRTDPAVLRTIGRSTLTSADLAALASGRMDQVFRPEGRLAGAPGQQNGAGRQGQGIQSRDAVRQLPQQSEQMSQRMEALQQSIIASQQQVISLMEENNRLQAEMRQLLEARVQQLEQENAASPSLDPAQQREGANQLETGTDQDRGERTEGEPEARAEGEPRTAGETEVGENGEDRTAGEAEVGEDGEARTTGEAEVGEGEPRGAGEAEVGEGEPRGAGETEVGEGEPRGAGEAEVGEDRGAGEAGVAEVGDDSGAQLGEGGEPQTPAEGWTVSSETQGESVRAGEAQEGRQTTGEVEAPAASAQGPAITPAQAVDTQRPGTDPQQAGVDGQPRGDDSRVAAAHAQAPQGPAAGERSQAEIDTANALKFNDATTPLNKVSAKRTAEAVKAGGDDSTRRQQQTGQATTTRSGPSGKDGR